MTKKLLTVEELAKDLVFNGNLNICVCDCIQCKTNSCYLCNLEDYPPNKKNELCDEKGTIKAIQDDLLSFAVQESEDLVKALENVDKRCLKHHALPKKYQTCLDVENWKERPEFLCHGCKAIIALTTFRNKYPRREV